MNEVKRYECSICKTIYSDMKTAVKCERTHKPGLKLVSAKYDWFKSFPTYVELQASDGTKMTYRANM